MNEEEEWNEHDEQDRAERSTDDIDGDEDYTSLKSETLRFFPVDIDSLRQPCHCHTKRYYTKNYHVFHCFLRV